jgi:hypothetical protein
MADKITNPTEALVRVGKENTELHEELARVYADLDHFRNGLTLISGMPYEPAAKVANNALAKRPLDG